MSESDRKAVLLIHADGYREHVHRPGRNECGAARAAYACTLAVINVHALEAIDRQITVELREGYE